MGKNLPVVDYDENNVYADGEDMTPNQAIEYAGQILVAAHNSIQMAAEKRAAGRGLAFEVVDGNMGGHTAP